MTVFSNPTGRLRGRCRDHGAAVAAQLGVTPMALYRHVGSKDGLLDAVVDHVYGQIELPPQDEPD